MIYKLHYTTKEGNEDTFSVIPMSYGQYMYKIKTLTNFKARFSTLKVIIGIAQAIRDKEGVVIHEDTIKGLEN